MPAALIDGKAIAEELRTRIGAGVADLQATASDPWSGCCAGREDRRVKFTSALRGGDQSLRHGLI